MKGNCANTINNFDENKQHCDLGLTKTIMTKKNRIIKKEMMSARTEAVGVQQVETQTCTQSLFNIIKVYFDNKGLLYCMRPTYHPSLSRALTSHPNSTKYLTISKCPAQIALCSAVIPSSFAALGFGT